jgi:hypothetical protein
VQKEKVLLQTEFKDSLGEGEFQVKIVQHFSNPVFGDAVEVDITHPEENFIETFMHQRNFQNSFIRTWILEVGVLC